MIRYQPYIRGGVEILTQTAQRAPFIPFQPDWNKRADGRRKAVWWFW